MIESHSKTMAAADYISRYRHVAKYIEACRACPGYGRRWGCPPYDDDPQPDLNKYEKVTLTVLKITPDDPREPLEAAQKIIDSARAEFEPRLLEEERRTGGRAALFTGRCPHCGEGACARASGAPCRHPDLVRPSLEALGFDLGATSREIFGIEMLWGENGKMPAYLTVIGGIFH